MNPIHVWTYWKGPRYPYIDVCLASMAQVCKVSGVQFHLVTPSTLNQFIDDGVIHPNYKKLQQLNMEANCVRAALLAKHGGWWWDADTVGLKSPLEITQAHPKAEMLYMTWSILPRRILNGYIYAQPKSEVAQEWLNQINHKLEHDLEKANIWLELGEKVLSPLLGKHPRCTELERRLFLPIDIDKHVARFFKLIDYKKYILEDTVCYGMNHSWFCHNRPKDIKRLPEDWASSPILFHQLMHATRNKLNQELIKEIDHSLIVKRARVIEPKDLPKQTLRKGSGLKTAVVTLATGEYLRGAKVLFHSLAKHGMPDNITRIVLNSNPNLPKLDFAERVSFEDVYQGIETKTGQFKETAKKFRALTLDFDRIIIIDSDIFCLQNCDFLWSNQISKLAFYAVHDSAAIQYYPEKIKELGLDKSLMMNAGTMVYNKWRMPDLHDHLLESIKKGICKTYDGGDQGYFNAFFQMNLEPIGYLPPGYNFCPDPNMPQVLPYARYLFHFAGGSKPWDSKPPRRSREYRKYAEQWKAYEKEIS